MTAMLTVRQRKNVVAKSAADGGRRRQTAGSRQGWAAGRRREAGRGGRQTAADVGRQAADTQPIIFLQSPPFGAGE